MMMTDLPAGTVTLLFTDIEGSTRLLERLRDRYVQVPGAHQQLLLAAFAQHYGHEVGAEGDAFFVAFAKASDAVAAVVAAQQALAAQRWPDGVALRVRMGSPHRRADRGWPGLCRPGRASCDAHLLGWPWWPSPALSVDPRAGQP